MTTPERRRDEIQRLALLRAELNPAQQDVLTMVEGLGWKLAFVRKPLFQNVVPVVHHAGKNQYGVLRDNGDIEIDPTLNVRTAE